MGIMNSPSVFWGFCRPYFGISLRFQESALHLSFGVAGELPVPQTDLLHKAQRVDDRNEMRVSWRTIRGVAWKSNSFLGILQLWEDMKFSQLLIHVHQLTIYMGCCVLGRACWRSVGSIPTRSWCKHPDLRQLLDVSLHSFCRTLVAIARYSQVK